MARGCPWGWKFVRRGIVWGGSSVAVTGRRMALRAALALGIAVTGLVLWVAAGGTHTARAIKGPVVAALDTMPVPTAPDEASYIKDQSAAVKLGKALFWDMQAGSDGRTACATCHFNAGADNRSKNQLNPRIGAFTTSGPNAQLTAEDFPFHKLADANDKASEVLSDTANVSGSQGVRPSSFIGIDPGDPVDGGALPDAPEPTFSLGGGNVRRPSGRHTPSVINAVSNLR